MTAYRDELDAARQRVAGLEEKLGEQDERLALLEKAVKGRDAQLTELRRRFDGAPSAVVGRRLRGALILAMALVLVSIAFAYFAIDRTERRAAEAADQARLAHDQAQEATRQAELARSAAASAAAPALTLADLLDPPRGATGPMDDQVPPGAVTRFDEKAQKEHLLAKARAGQASSGELRMLKAICMNDGDRACRSFAVTELNKLSAD